MSQDKGDTHCFRTIALEQNDALDRCHCIDEVCSKFKEIVMFTFDVSRHSRDSIVLIENMQLEHAYTALKHQFECMAWFMKADVIINLY